MWPPDIVLHTELISNDAGQLREALLAPDKPKVVVVAHEGMPVGAAESLLIQSGLWLIEK